VAGLDKGARRDAAGRYGQVKVEPPFGIEPMTYSLQDGRQGYWPVRRRRLHREGRSVDIGRGSDPQRPQDQPQRKPQPFQILADYYQTGDSRDRQLWDEIARHP
jgi:hypothetical protein